MVQPHRVAHFMHDEVVEKLFVHLADLFGTCSIHVEYS